MNTRPTTRNIFVCLFFILGIICPSVGLLTQTAVFFGLLLILTALICAFKYLDASFIRFLPLLFFSFLLGFLWLVVYLKPVLVNQFNFQKYQTYQGVVREVVHQAEKQKLEVLTDNGLIQLFTKVWPQFWPGDQISWRCKLWPVLLKQTINQGVLAQCRSDQAYKKDSHNSLVKIFSQQKDYLQNILNQRLSHPASDLAAGLLWGERTSLPADLANNFKRVGLSHIVAVSGYNFTIMLLALGQVLIWLGLNKRKSWWLQLLVILAFVIFTGASASVLRAGIMAALVVISYSLGRKAGFVLMLFYALVFMAWLKPTILVFDIGLQLSVAATCGLVFLARPLEKLLKFVPVIIKETLSTTIAAIVATTPIILCYFGNFSLVALLANLLVLPLISWNMLWALLTLLLGGLPGIGLIVSSLTQISFMGLIKTINFLGSWPWASSNLEANAGWLGLYLIIVPLIIWLIKKDEKF